MQTQVVKETPAQELARLRAENEKLKAAAAARANRPITLKVSEKKALSAYGMGRFPITLYKSQWVRLLSMADEIKAFIAEHNAELADKPEVV